MAPRIVPGGCDTWEHAFENAAGQTVSSIAYGYDLADHLTSKTTTGTASAAANTYGYDFAGRLTSWTASGTTTAYQWDAAGNRVQAGSKAASFDARNRLLSDGTSTYAYTPRGTLASKRPRARPSRSRSTPSTA